MPPQDDLEYQYEPQPFEIMTFISPHDPSPLLRLSETVSPVTYTWIVPLLQENVADNYRRSSSHTETCATFGDFE